MEKENKYIKLSQLIHCEIVGFFCVFKYSPIQKSRPETGKSKYSGSFLFFHTCFCFSKVLHQNGARTGVQFFGAYLLS